MTDSARSACGRCTGNEPDTAADVLHRRAELAAFLRDYARPRLPLIREVCGPAWDPAAPELLDLVDDDLTALVVRDPATHGSWQATFGAYRSFRAVVAYRLAHAIRTAAHLRGSCVEHSMLVARDISEQAKLETGVEIHPGAEIGPRFVVDHGVGTVIGETTVIGSDCYLLQCVVLGSVRVADNIEEKRHPTLGDRVEIGAYARILGPVRVGDDVRIGAHALVREDVPAGARVRVLHQYQVVAGATNLAIAGVESVGRDRYRVHGTGLADRLLRVEQVRDGETATVAIVERGADHLVVEVPNAVAGCHTRLLVRAQDGSSITLVLPALHTGPSLMRGAKTRSAG